MSSSRWTQADVDRHNRKLKAPKGQQRPRQRPAIPDDEPKPAAQRTRQRANKTEAEYHAMLVAATAGHDPKPVIRFQPVRIYLSNQHSYRPDFGVFWPSGQVEMHEVKGPHIYSRDSKILFDTARSDYPWWRWVWAQKQKGGRWTFRTYHPEWRRS